MELADLHIPYSLSPDPMSAVNQQSAHEESLPKACQKQQQHAFRVYETETGSKTISNCAKLNTLQRQQLVAVVPSHSGDRDGSSVITEVRLKNGDTNRGGKNKRCTEDGSIHEQVYFANNNQPIQSECSLPRLQPCRRQQKQSSSQDLAYENEPLFPNPSLSSTNRISPKDKHHITQRQVNDNYLQLFRQISPTCKSRYNSIIKRDASNGSRADRTTQPLLSVILSLAVFIILFQQISQAKSIHENNETNLLRNQLLEHEVILTTVATLDQPTTPIATKTTLGGLFTRISSAFKKSPATATTKTTTPTTTSDSITTTLEPETDNYREDESSTGRDDDDAEGCSGLSTNESAETKNLTDNERLVNLQSCFQRKMKQTISKATRDGLEVFEKLSLSGGCSASLMKLAYGLSEIKSFAFKFLDASAKIPSGVMYGLLSDYGDFDECLSIKSDPNVPVEEEAQEGTFSGKYCLISANLNYHVNLSSSNDAPEGIISDGVFWDELVRNYWTTKSVKGFQFGMCFPSRCTDDDIDQLYQYLAKSYHVDGKIINCQDGLNLKQQLTKDLIQQLIVYAFYGLIGLTIVATALDRYYPELVKDTAHQKCSLELLNQLSSDSIDSVKSRFDCVNKLAFAFRILTCFSIIKNWKSFTRSDQPGNNQWDCPSEFYSSPMSTNRNSHVNNESIDSEGASLDKKDLDSPVESTANIFNNQISIEQHHQYQQNINNNSSNDKLCQLIVRIQPNRNPESASNKSLRHLSGLKLLVILWITIGHSFLYPSANNYQYYRSIINMKITKYSVWFATTNFTLGIDMLLYMIGLSFVYKLAKVNSKPHYDRGYSMGFKINSGGLLRLISKKVLRFWATYLTLIALAIVVPILSEGPMWPEMVSKRIGDSCRKNWWSNILFINNIFKESEICLPSSWFVSILMQLFVIGSVIIVISSKISNRAGLYFTSSLLIASCAISFTFAYLTKVRAPIIRMDESFILEPDENIFSLYTSIFNNLGPFLAGMIGGFLLIDSQITRLNEVDQVFSRKGGRSDTSIIDAITSYVNMKFILISLITIIIAVLVLSTVFYQDYTLFWSSTYWSLHRVGWAIVTGYIVHNCATGRFQLLNDLLSLSTFIPISRLIPIAYLVYPIFIHIHSGLVRDGLHVSIYNMLNIYITRLSMTFMVAFLIHVLVELPLCSIEEIYLNRWVKRLRISEKESKNSHPLLAVAPLATSRLIQD